ncbi:ZIP family metal transporter [Pseudidiomarina terrestris]|uniref:Divalent cation transporter n=2 Tax=Pseudidiomarina terrestris TaxID=2820060 RepID=A0AAW7QZV2_9GAMM|nr:MULTISPECIES: ZIP family metal transporter [unclassified Pseudidiomarina]MDN7124554.1 divalent cation transporter [Pseudidiomarina sp. 1APP75-32.1]MDN7136749.1 divalent cation transporter [Pseudidiomarina sp. 1ASP75-14]MDN7129155.1 divalent cation transporter [Pseudidiomarina sp. 1APR75-15]MDN7134582.1 divalent cation transporter [Pseudidiomarina sp. 1ASP75-5]MEA3587631.1 divalent cation transporter [Pseudidiomarina sp. 1APP75-27a]
MVLKMLFVTWLAGLAAFVGAVLAKWEGRAGTLFKQRFVHGVVAAGGGILLAAVMYALLPEANKYLSVWSVAAAFIGGGVTFCIIDEWLAKKMSRASQLLAMLLDFVPEALSLGAMFAVNPSFGMLLALFIGLQNFPEGFNAFRELEDSKVSARRRLVGFFLVSFVGPIAALAGYYWLGDFLQTTAVIMAAASGGILYLIFQDIAPESTMRRHWTPPLGAVIGFVVGMVGHQLLAG